MTNDASSPPADENTGASKKLIGSAVVVAAIVVLGLVLSLTNIFGGETEPTANPSAPSPSTATATATVAPTMGLLPMPKKPIIST